MPDVSAAEAQAVLPAIEIPSCPAVLIQLNNLLRDDDADFRVVSSVLMADVGLAATVLKLANSPALKLPSKVSSIQQALSVLGVTRVMSMVSGIVLRQALAGGQGSMERFWDTSARRAMLMSKLARSFPGISSDLAYTFGLFMDCGIAVLIQKFPNYKQTLAIANAAVSQRFTEIEEAAHQINHASVGYWLARSWHLDKDLAEAIRFHHEYEVLAEDGSGLSPRTRHLVAFGLLSEHLIQAITGLNHTVEWNKGAPYVKAYLGLTDDEIKELIMEVREFFV